MSTDFENDSDFSSVYGELRSCPLSELSRTLVACGVDKAWALQHVGVMRETLCYNVIDVDDTWSLARIDREIYSDGSDPEHYADMLLDDMGFDELDKVCQNIAAGRKWDYEPESATDLSSPWETVSKSAVTVEAGDDDVEVDSSDELPF
jgi:hypothetical protein